MCTAISELLSNPIILAGVMLVAAGLGWALASIGKS